MFKTMLSIVVTIAIVGTVYYFTSDVGRARIESAHQTYATWTSENITKNPELYLDACERDATESLQKLRANEIFVIRQTEDLKRKIENTQANVEVAGEELATLRGLYNQESMSWPLQWRGRSLDEEAYRRQVVYLHEDVNRQARLAEQYGEAYNKAKGSPAAIATAKVQLQSHLAEIRVQRDLLAVKQISATVAEQILNIRTALQDVSVLVTGTSSQALLGVNDLAALREEPGRPDDEAFRKAMGW